jgi:hypothetical protein
MQLKNQLKKMNKLILIIILILIQSSCANKSVNVNKLFIKNKFTEYEVIKLTGYLFILNEDINLYHNKNSDDYIDIIFNKNMIFDKPFKENNYICVDLQGKYIKYNTDPLWIGNADGKYGIINVSEITRCK